MKLNQACSSSLDNNIADTSGKDLEVRQIALGSATYNLKCMKVLKPWGSKTPTVGPSVYRTHKIGDVSIPGAPR